MPSLCSHTWRLFKSSYEPRVSFTGETFIMLTRRARRDSLCLSVVLLSSSDHFMCQPRHAHNHTKYHGGESSEVLLHWRGLWGQFCASHHPLPLRTARLNWEEKYNLKYPFIFQFWRALVILLEMMMKEVKESLWLLVLLPPWFGLMRSLSRGWTMAILVGKHCKHLLPLSLTASAKHKSGIEREYLGTNNSNIYYQSFHC